MLSSMFLKYDETKILFSYFITTHVHKVCRDINCKFLILLGEPDTIFPKITLVSNRNTGFVGSPTKVNDCYSFYCIKITSSKFIYTPNLYF